MAGRDWKAAIAILAIACISIYLARMDHKGPAMAIAKDVSHRDSTDPKMHFGDEEFLGNVNRHPLDGNVDSNGLVSEMPEANAPDINACLEIADRQVRFQCVKAFLLEAGELGPELLGENICALLSGGGATERLPSVISACISEWISSDPIDNLDRIQSTCPGFQTGDLIKYAMLDSLQFDAVLVDALSGHIYAESAYFDDRTEMAVVLAAEIGLATGNQRMKDLLIAGAKGEFGGTAAQIDFSALCVVRLIDETPEVIDFVNSIARSSTIPAGAGELDMGGSLMHILSMDRVVSEISEYALMDAVTNVLGHPILGKSAAKFIIDIENSGNGSPFPFNEGTLASIVAHAKAIYIGP